MIPKSENETRTLPTGSTETALRVFHRIAHAWGLDDSEMSELLGTSGSTDEVMSEAAMERISYVFGVYKNLKIIFPTEQQANEWVRKPNKAFDNRAAIEAMIDDPATVRRYLDSQLA